MVKEFKFFQREIINPEIKIYNLNVLDENNPLGRIPSSRIAFVPFDGMHSGDLRGPLRNLFDSRWQVGAFSSMIIVRQDGYQTIITHDTINHQNSQGRIYSMNDYVMVRYNPI